MNKEFCPLWGREIFRVIASASVSIQKVPMTEIFIAGWMSQLPVYQEKGGSEDEGKCSGRNASSGD